jgi:glycosyltransferase involved in cell wall biosynthesis
VRIVLTIHHHLDAGAGAPGVTLALRDAYREAGHEASILSFDDMPASTPDRVRELLFPEFVATRLARARREVDVVDASTGDAWVWARIRQAIARALLVTRLHGLEHVFWEQELREAVATGKLPPLTTRLYHGGARLREVAAALRGSDACFFLNAGERARAVAQLGVRPETAFVVPNGIPESMIGLPAPGPPEHGVRLAHVGSWAPRKGIRHLAPAASAVLARHPAATLSYLGTRAPAGEVLEAHAPGIRDRIRVVERYDRLELPALLAGHQVVVSASLAEGFSLALPEAMACGLAPVATALDGTREIVRDGETGVLVPPGDAGALERALDELLADPGRLARLRMAAHASVQQLGWPQVAAGQLERYAQLLRRRVASPPPSPGGA